MEFKGSESRSCLYLHDNLSIAVVMSISNKLVNESKGLCTADTIQSIHQAVSAALTTLQSKNHFEKSYRKIIPKSELLYLLPQGSPAAAQVLYLL